MGHDPKKTLDFIDKKKAERFLEFFLCHKASEQDLFKKVRLLQKEKLESVIPAFMMLAMKYFHEDCLHCFLLPRYVHFNIFCFQVHCYDMAI